MPALDRADTSLLGRWWWSLDRPTLIAVGLLLGFGYIMVLAASPAVAVRIGDARDALIVKQMLFLAVGGLVVVAVSTLSPREIRRLALLGGIAALLLTAYTLVGGVQIKGARRWIALPGFAVQPSEFLKPCFAVITAWLLAQRRRQPRFPGLAIAFGLLLVVLALLKAQPDVGMSAVIAAVFFAQLIIDGLNLWLVGAGLGMFVAAGAGAWLAFAHVRSRVHDFLHPTMKDAYQVLTALEAFGNGGLFGRGPGEGTVKNFLPDAHADFVFAVLGEEFGLIVCLLIVGIFGFIVWRGLLRLLTESDHFVVLAASGLLVCFGLQAFINMASALELIPAKGMTLPFISYGGSSMISVSLVMGMALALTRKRHHGDPV